MPGTISYVKAILVGRPKATSTLHEERLTKKVGLAVFASDNLSSSAYATEEMLLVLVLGGAAALSASIPITLTIVAVLAVIAISYRETIHAYPSGGGAYIVAHDNLGRNPGLVAASALLIDYVLTVAVSISAGIAAVLSAAPGLEPLHVPLAVAVIAVVTMLNLRGVRESGAIFAVPTYGFVLLMSSLIVWGLVRYFVFGYRPPPSPAIPAHQALTIFLVLRAFSHGATAVTGIEAISNGVQAFREPSARNASMTLGIMAAILGFLFIGTTVLTQIYGITGPSEEPKRTVVALIALTVFGPGALFIAVQTATALILFLAANTSYADFPRLSAVLAKDRFAPRQLLNRGDRLAYSNGIVALAVLASVLVIVFDADVSRLINLYVVGVFTSLTLSQLGMVRHWAEYRGEQRRWRLYLVINAVGATATFLVFLIVLSTKFVDGAWMVVVGAPLLIGLLDRTNRHYGRVARQLRDPARAPKPWGRHHVIVLVGRPSLPERRAVAYAQLIKGAILRCVHFSTEGDPPELVSEWSRELAGVPSLELVPRRGSLGRSVRDYVVEFRQRIPERDIVTVVVPERLRSGVGGLLSSRETLLVKTMLLFVPRVFVADVTFHERQPESTLEPGPSTKHIALVLISAVHHASMRALEYARTVRADELKVLHVQVDPDSSRKVVFDWEVHGTGTPLEVLDSPYRELTTPVRAYVRDLVSDGRTVVTLVLPEFVVAKRWHNLLHNQNALQIKRTFLFEPNVVVTSVPTKLDPD